MTTTQTSVRFSDGTKAKLDWLAERFNSQTEAIAVAIDRLYQDEHAAANPPNCEECGTPLAWSPVSRQYFYNCDC